MMHFIVCGDSLPFGLQTERRFGPLQDLSE
jgi:hypothetical protein